MPAKASALTMVLTVLMDALTLSWEIELGEEKPGRRLETYCQVFNGDWFFPHATLSVLRRKSWRKQRE